MAAIRAHDVRLAPERCPVWGSAASDIRQFGKQLHNPMSEAFPQPRRKNATGSIRRTLPQRRAFAFVASSFPASRGALFR